MAAPLTIAELERLLTEADPGVVLLSPRLMRRVIRLDCNLPGMGLHVPHQKTYVVPRARLQAYLGPDDSEAAHRPELPELALLLARPDQERLEKLGRERALEKYWRRLFHAAVDRRTAELRKNGWSAPAVREKIARIGQAEFDEIRAVLRTEEYLLPPETESAALAEFLAVFSELQLFAPEALRSYFPSLEDPARVEAMIATDVDVGALFAATRPRGANDPAAVRAGEAKGLEASAVWGDPALAPLPSAPDRFRRLQIRGVLAEGRGNHVRAAILHGHAQRIAGAESRDAARREALVSLARLADRLGAALGADAELTASFRKILPDLLPGAAAGVWTQAARLLYDLQKICIDREQEIFVVDFWTWLFSFGRRPLRRPAPLLRESLGAQHLRTAANRLNRVALPDSSRAELESALKRAADEGATALRRRVEPVLAERLKASGLKPDALPESVAFGKVVGELGDRIVGKGHFSLSQLRDAIAQNDLKLPDIPNPIVFVVGDALIRTDRALGRELDGVYRPGEFYLRWLLRFTGLAYGTRVGRFVTRWIALPVGGAYLILEGLQHTLFVIPKVLFGWHVHLAQPLPWSMLAAVILACLHIEGFAGRLLKTSAAIGRGLKAVFWTFPVWLMQLPALQRFFNSPAFDLVRRTLVLPAMATFGLLKLLPIAADLMMHYLIGRTDYQFTWPEQPAIVLGVVFVMLAAAFNAPFGRRLENAFFDRMYWLWNRIQGDFIPGLFRWIMDFFRGIQEGAERFLYAVDEKLRFRTGESPLSLAFKAVVGAVWGVFEYVIRCVLNLVVEPQVNPIKHFPVVTVSHKMMIPMAGDVKTALEKVVAPQAAVATTGALLFSLPGVCGFLAWELLTNWRLYEANRRRRIGAAAIGSHGETALRFLKPGFHSGTLPKLFQKLRRAQSQAQSGGDSRKPARVRETLRHNAETIRHFADRIITPYLAASPAWREAPPAVDSVHVASRRFELKIVFPKASTAMRAVVEEQSGWLVVRFPEGDWLEQIQGERRTPFRNAIVGWCLQCGIDFSTLQIEAALAARIGTGWRFDICDRGLAVWRPETGAETTFHLDRDAAVYPAVKSETGNPILASIDARSLWLGKHPVRWEEWLKAWSPREGSADLWPGIKLFPGDTGSQAVSSGAAT